MSIATESLSSLNISQLKKIEHEAREIAKEHGAKIRRKPHRSGIDVKFSDGSTKHYHGWNQLLSELASILAKEGECK